MTTVFWQHNPVIYLHYCRSFPFQSKASIPHLLESLNHFVNVLHRMTELGQPELVLENNNVYLSCEIKLAYEMIGSVLHRPQNSVDLHSLVEDTLHNCSTSTVIIKVWGVGSAMVQ